MMKPTEESGPSIIKSSMGNFANFLGYLEHFDVAQTDGSIGICIASGKGNFISKVRPL